MQTLTEIVAAVVVHSSAVAYSHFGVAREAPKDIARVHVDVGLRKLFVPQAGLAADAGAHDQHEFRFAAPAVVLEPGLQHFIEGKSVQ